MKKIYQSVAASLAAVLISACSCFEPSKPYDVVVYGGTSAGVVAAVQAAKSGKSVVLIAPEGRLGAMSSSGLGQTDSGRTAAIGGLSREFYHRIWLEYTKPETWKFTKRENHKIAAQGVKAIDDEKQVMWHFEPSVAERVYDNWVAEYKNIKLVKGQWLDRESGVEKVGARIVAISTLDGERFPAKMFIDCTFEGDLMAAAGVEYFVGREANSKYGEDYNGFRATNAANGHRFHAKIDPYKVKGDKSSGLLNLVSSEPPLADGVEDKKVQAYNFRLCLTKVPENRVQIEKPEGYNPDDFELAARYFEAEPNAFPLIISAIPNGKTDVNNCNAISTDFIGGNYEWPEASYERRAEIFKAHLDYHKKLLYFFQNDPRVPENIRNEIAKYGLAKDEFASTGHWPFNLYIREARRMVGEYVMTQHDCQNTRLTPRPVGMGSYTLDSHNTSRYVTREGYVQNEGDVQVGLNAPYKIAYGSIIPKKAQAENLFVPVASSASHIAYGSIRMEPVFMILGQSAATAAVQAIDDKCAVQDVDYAKLSKTLERDGQILNLSVQTANAK